VERADLEGRPVVSIPEESPLSLAVKSLSADILARVRLSPP